MATEPLVSELDKTSALWLKLVAHYEERLATLRKKNDGDKGEEPTAKLRGRIAEVKHLLALDKPAPAIEAEHGAD